MKRRNRPRTGPILILAVFSLICWAETGNTFEQWDAMTSANVNLRKHPRTNGVILSIVPKGYKINIIEKNGHWYKVDVEGEIHGKGWMYAGYVQIIPPKSLITKPAFEKVTREIASEEQLKGTHPAESPPKVHILSLHPPYSGFKKDAPAAGGKPSSWVMDRRYAPLHQLSLPAGEKKPAAVVRQIPPAVKERAVPISLAIAHSVERPAKQKPVVSPEKKGPMHRLKSTVLLELTLKLLSIALSCLIILFFYRAQKNGTDLLSKKYSSSPQNSQPPAHRAYAPAGGR